MRPHIRPSAIAPFLLLASLLLGACKSERQRDPIIKTNEEHRWSQLFKMVDANADGKITREEFQAHYVSVTWLYFDKNGDGVITAKEWSLDGMTPERKAWFQGLDEDGDGQVTRTEFQRAVTPEGVDYFFELMDRNGDGVLTKKELQIR